MGWYNSGGRASGFFGVFGRGLDGIRAPRDWRAEGRKLAEGTPKVNGTTNGDYEPACFDQARRGESTCLDYSGVAGLVIRDLKAEEGVDGLKGFRIGGGNLDFRATGSLKVAIADLVAELCHGSGAGRRRVVDKHRNVEVARSKAIDDMR